MGSSVGRGGRQCDSVRPLSHGEPRAPVGPEEGRTARTLRISAFSLDMTPLSGAGTLFELKMTRVSKTADTTQLLWVAPPNFIFIDSDLNTHKPGTAVPGSVEPLRR